MQKSKKLAVLVGCNYPKTKMELHGCQNDVLAMKQLLIRRFGFNPYDINVLIDKAGGGILSMPTGANIIGALNKMVDKAESGDVLFFHYSGHGTLLDHTTLLPFLREEAIVPTDLNLITSVDFRHLVNKVPKGATFTILSDSCHSGGLIDKEKEQIGPSNHQYYKDPNYYSPPSSHPKFTPIQSILHHLSSLTNINSTDLGAHLIQIFGPNASLRFRLPQEELSLLQPLKQDQGILLSGCQTNETSSDVKEDDGRAFGAFSNAVQEVFKGHSRTLSNREVVAMVRKLLEVEKFKQHPCLYCSDENANAAFLCEL